MIPIDDRGLTLGDGLFETLLAVDGQLVDWQAHLDRMGRGAALLGLPEPDAFEARVACSSALGAANLRCGRAAVRLTLTAGSGGRGLDRPQAMTARMFAAASPALEPSGPFRLMLSTVRRNAASPASRLKTLSYLDNVLARREATGAGADEAVMLNTDGHVACAAAGNLFWIDNGRLFTPSLDCGVLDGIMRSKVLARAAQLRAEVAQGAFAPEALRAAQAVLVTNSLIGVRRVSQIGGRACGEDRLAEALAGLRADG